MDRDVVLEEVISAVADVLGLAPDRLGIETEGADVEAWDSFGHVRIVLALEARFHIEMSMGEIERSGSIQGLVEIVEAGLHRKKKPAPPDGRPR